MGAVCGADTRSHEHTIREQKALKALRHYHIPMDDILQAVRTSWARTDINKDGKVDRKELAASMLTMMQMWAENNPNLSFCNTVPGSVEEMSDRSARIMDELDINKDGVLDEKEFRLFVYQMLLETIEREHESARRRSLFKRPEQKPKQHQQPAENKRTGAGPEETPETAAVPAETEEKKQKKTQKSPSKRSRRQEFKKREEVALKSLAGLHVPRKDVDAAVKSLWENTDENKDGFVDHKELMNCMLKFMYKWYQEYSTAQAPKLEVMEEKSKAILEDMDIDREGNGKLDFAEFRLFVYLILIETVQVVIPPLLPLPIHKTPLVIYYGQTPDAIT
uniref:EF-hand domain-containing protein n=1 Tax=Lotharella globosa TaxID=91324 RepID=A0A7S3YX89_9EUKA